VGRDAGQPGPQQIRARQFRRIGQCQAGGDEDITGGGDCRVRVGP
jgi:hypothetical protein